MNAPVLDHPYSLMESVFNDLVYDCSSMQNRFPPGSNESCSLWEQESAKVRSDLQFYTRLMLQDQYRKKRQLCESQSYQYYRGMLNSLCSPAQRYQAERIHRFLWTLGPCILPDPDSSTFSSELVDLLQENFRVSDCHLAGAFEEAVDFCPRDSNTDYIDCLNSPNYDSFDNVPDDVICDATAVVKIMAPLIFDQHRFTPGIILKSAREGHGAIPGMVDNLQYALLAQDGVTSQPNECIHGAFRSSLRSCSPDYFATNIDLIYKVPKQ